MTSRSRSRPQQPLAAEEMKRLRRFVDDLGQEPLDQKDHASVSITALIDGRNDSLSPAVKTMNLNARDFAASCGERAMDRCEGGHLVHVTGRLPRGEASHSRRPLRLAVNGLNAGKDDP